MKRLDDYITHDWRENGEEINPKCNFYNKRKDECEFPDKALPGETGCLGEICFFYKDKKIMKKDK